MTITFQNQLIHIYWWLIHLGIIALGLFWFPGQIHEEGVRLMHSEAPVAHGIRQRMTWTMIVFALNVVAFYRVRFSCPGFALPDADPFDDDDDIEKLLIETGRSSSSGKSSKFCQQCKVEQQLAVKHCKICNRCVIGWDHHCIWVGQCIGIQNHRYFLLYLGSQTLCTILALDLLITAKLDLGSNRLSVWILLNFFLTVSLIIIGGLFCWHTCCAFSGHTTRELMNIAGGKEEEDLRGGTCTRCCWSLEGFIAGRPSKAIKRRPPGSYRCLEAMDLVCDNSLYSCF